MKAITISIIIFCLGFVSYSQDKPNILWITYEDTSPQFIGSYGNKDASTPVMDTLATEGVRFTNAFSTGTVCSASRSTIITGARTFEMGSGNHRSNYPVPEFIHGFPYYLQKAGYYTSNNRKTDYNVKDMKAFTQDAWNESSNKAGWWNRKPGQPFFAVFNFMDSHQSRTMTSPYSFYLKNVLNKLSEEEQIGEKEFSMPPIYNDSPEMRKQFARVYNSIKLTDNKIGELLEKLDRDGLTENTIILCFADHGEGMPRGKTNGIDYGYRVPFIAWFPEKYKHLSPWKTGGVVTDELIDFEDLAPTMLNIVGEEIPEYMNGRILMGKNRSKPVESLELSSDRSDNGIDMVRSITNGKYMYSRNYMPYMPEGRYIRFMEIGAIKQQMRKDLASGKLDSIQKSLFEPRSAEYLFNIEKDQWETHNLITDASSQKILKKMRKELDEKILKSRDIMFLPEYEIEKISKTITPYEYRLSDSNYPIDKIYAAAFLSGKRGEDVASKQMKLLKSNNKIVRYWAILGLLSQQKVILRPLQSEILEALSDAYPPVKITAAAVAYTKFDDKTAKEILKKQIKNKNDLLALMSINYLLYTKNKQPFIAAIKQVKNEKNRSYNVKAACLDFLGILGLIPNDYAHGWVR